jgi:hypothetical protein
VKEPALGETMEVVEPRVPLKNKTEVAVNE